MSDKDKVVRFPTDYSPEKPTRLSSDEYVALNTKLEVLSDEIIYLSKIIRELIKAHKKRT